MSNVHLPFVSVYQRMTDFVHTLAYASAIRNSVTGLLVKACILYYKELFYKDIQIFTFLPATHCYHVKLTHILFQEKLIYSDNSCFKLAINQETKLSMVWIVFEFYEQCSQCPLFTQSMLMNGGICQPYQRYYIYM